jgi:hypothetical protein
MWGFARNSLFVGEGGHARRMGLAPIAPPRACKMAPDPLEDEQSAARELSSAGGGLWQAQCVHATARPIG